MIQEILTALIILTALAVVIKKLIPKPRNTDPEACGGCSSDCSGCAVNDIKEEIRLKHPEKQAK